MFGVIFLAVVGLTIASDEACPMNGVFGYGPKVIMKIIIILF